MAHNAAGTTLETRITVTDPAVRSYSFEFAVARAEDVSVLHGDIPIEPERYRLELSGDRSSGTVYLLGPGETAVPVVLAADDQITIQRDTEVRRPTSFGTRGYASAPAAEVLAAYLHRILQELAARVESHAAIVVSEAEIREIVRTQVQGGGFEVGLDHLTTMLQGLINRIPLAQTVRLDETTLVFDDPEGRQYEVELSDLEVGVTVENKGVILGNYRGIRTINTTGDSTGGAYFSVSGDEATLHVAVPAGGTPGSTDTEHNLNPLSLAVTPRAAVVSITPTTVGVWSHPDNAAWETILTSGAIAAEDAGVVSAEVVLRGNVTTDTTGGGDRVYVESKIIRTRGSVDTELDWDLLYIRNGGNFGSDALETVSQMLEQSYSIWDDAEAGDTYKVEARVICQGNLHTVQFSTDSKLEIVTGANIASLTTTDTTGGGGMLRTDAQIDALIDANEKVIRGEDLDEGLRVNFMLGMGDVTQVLSPASYRIGANGVAIPGGPTAVAYEFLWRPESGAQRFRFRLSQLTDLPRAGQSAALDDTNSLSVMHGGQTFRLGHSMHQGRDEFVFQAENTGTYSTTIWGEPIRIGTDFLLKATATERGGITLDEIDARIKEPARAGSTAKFTDADVVQGAVGTAGVVALANDRLADEGTDTTSAMTPAQVKRRIDAAGPGPGQAASPLTFEDTANEITWVAPPSGSPNQRQARFAGKAKDVQNAFLEGGWSDVPAGAELVTPYVSQPFANRPAAIAGANFTLAGQHPPGDGTDIEPAFVIVRLPAADAEMLKRNRLVLKTSLGTFDPQDVFAILPAERLAADSDASDDYEYFVVRLIALADGETYNVQEQEPFRRDAVTFPETLGSLDDVSIDKAASNTGKAPNLRADGSFELGWSEPVPQASLPHRLIAGERYSISREVTFDRWVTTGIPRNVSDKWSASFMVGGETWSLHFYNDSRFDAPVRRQVVLERQAGSTVTPLALAFYNAATGRFVNVQASGQLSPPYLNNYVLQGAPSELRALMTGAAALDVRILRDGDPIHNLPASVKHPVGDYTALDAQTLQITPGRQAAWATIGNTDPIPSTKLAGLTILEDGPGRGISVTNSGTDVNDASSPQAMDADFDVALDAHAASRIDWSCRFTLTQKSDRNLSFSDQPVTSQNPAVNQILKRGFTYGRRINDAGAWTASGGGVLMVEAPVYLNGNEIGKHQGFLAYEVDAAEHNVVPRYHYDGATGSSSWAVGHDNEITVDVGSSPSEIFEATDPRGRLIATFDFGSSAITLTPGNIATGITPTVEAAFRSHYTGGAGFLNVPKAPPAGNHAVGWVVVGKVGNDEISVGYIPAVMLIAVASLSARGTTLANLSTGIGAVVSNDATTRLAVLEYQRQFNNRQDIIRLYGPGAGLNSYLANTSVEIYEFIV